MVLRSNLPYRTLSDIIDGVVITFSDITEYKISTSKLHETQKSLQGK
jgi:hypothetical protein